MRVRGSRGEWAEGPVDVGAGHMAESVRKNNITHDRDDHSAGV